MFSIGNISVDELAREYKTPLYVYDEAALRERCSDFVSLFRSDEFETGVLYASKAFSCKAMVSLIDEYGLYLDVVSGGELYTAKKAGFDCGKMFFHGNNKSREELEMAADYGVGTIVVDNEMEAELLTEVMKTKDGSINTILRVNPGIEAHTHEYVVTAHDDSKFGIGFTQEEKIIETIKILTSSDKIAFSGIHAHIGSQIFDKQAFVEEIKKLFAFAKRLKDEYGIDTDTINLGGGFAVTYTEKDAPIPLDELFNCIFETCSEENKKMDGQIKKLYIEPGRSISAEAGYMLYTIGYTKQTPHKLYAFVDGGMSDNIRPALYQAEYDAVVAGKEDAEEKKTYCVAGKCCESGDELIQQIDLPEVKAGDILVVKTAGAYEYAMSSRYNKLPRPAVVFAENGKSRVVVERETYDDLIYHEK